MKTFRFAILVLGLVLAGGCGQHAAKPLAPQEISAADSSASQLILVTFLDRSIGRTIPNGVYGLSAAQSGYQVSSWSRRKSHALATTHRLKYRDGWNIESLSEYCAIFEIPPGQSVERTVDELARNPQVRTVQPVRNFESLGATYSDPYFKLQSGLRPMQIQAVHGWVTGRNVRVAVIDTAIDGAHPELRGQVERELDFVGKSPERYSGAAHGTAVAGIIAARADNGLGIVGIAPQAQLISVKSCWSSAPDSKKGICDSLSLAQGIDAAIRLQPEILNLSLAGPPDPLLTRLIEKAIAQGIIVVAADPGTSVFRSRFPASIPNVIAVRATPRMAAADVALTPSALWAPGTEIYTTFPNDRYEFVTGSSFAAAHVTGIVALLLELDPQLTAARAKEILQLPRQHMEKVADARMLTEVNACAAIARLRGRETCTQESAPKSTSAVL